MEKFHFELKRSVFSSKRSPLSWKGVLAWGSFIFRWKNFNLCLLTTDLFWVEQAFLREKFSCQLKKFHACLKGCRLSWEKGLFIGKVSFWSKKVHVQFKMISFKLQKVFQVGAISFWKVKESYAYLQRISSELKNYFYLEKFYLAL